MRIRELVPWRSRERGQLTRTGAGDAFAEFQTRMGRMFDEFFEGFDLAPFGKSMLSESGTMPKIDVAETDSEIHVTAELPGMKEDEIEVALAEGHLVIRGDKKAEKEEKNKNYFQIERSYGSFHRSIPLPTEVDDKNVDASFKNGVLSIVLPKVARSAVGGKKIEVKRPT